MMKKLIQITPLLTVALLLSGGGSLVSAATIVTQYQYNPNGDWFADPPQPPNPPGGDFNLVPYTTNAGHAAGRLTLRTQGVANSGGMSLLAWSSAPNTMLNGVDFLLSIGPSSGSGGPADYTDGCMRVAVQDTLGTPFRKHPLVDFG